MENKLLMNRCKKCGAFALPFREAKANESDYQLIGIACFECGNNVLKPILKTASAEERDAAMMAQLALWNKRNKNKSR